MFFNLKTNHTIFYISLLFNVLFIGMLMNYMEVSINLPIEIEYVNEAPREILRNVYNPQRDIFSNISKKVIMVL